MLTPSGRWEARPLEVDMQAFPTWSEVGKKICLSNTSYSTAHGHSQQKIKKGGLRLFKATLALNTFIIVCIAIRHR